jgi:hypothetical protein
MGVGPKYRMDAFYIPIEVHLWHWNMDRKPITVPGVHSKISEEIS